MERRSGSREEHRPAAGANQRLLRWLRALAPLLERDAPLTEAQAEIWRHRLSALIASGEMLRYQCARASGQPMEEAAADLLAQTLVEARALLAELERAPCDTQAADPESLAPRRPPEALQGALETARERVFRSAALRELEGLLQAPGEVVGPPPPRELTVPPGRVPGLRGFNLGFFAFLGFQTLVWTGGALSGAESYALFLYALILAPFWWWGGYLLQALALAVCPEQITLAGRTATIQRPWPRATVLELDADPSLAVGRECWFEINRHAVHCLTLRGADGRHVRFAVGRDTSEHERLMREIEAHLALTGGRS